MVAAVRASSSLPSRKLHRGSTGDRLDSGWMKGAPSIPRSAALPEQPSHGTEDTPEYHSNRFDTTLLPRHNPEAAE